MSDQQHFTTRRGFVGAVGFGALGLYVTWAAYGASPLPFFSHPSDEPMTDAHGGSGHGDEQGGHGDPAVSVPGSGHGAEGLTPADFEARQAAFLKRFRQADGSVRLAGTDAADDSHAESGSSHSHDATMSGHMAMTGGGSHETGAASAPTGHDHGAAASSGPIEVYLTAARFAFEPDNLVLESGRTYRFHMMASDITHGASIAFGSGSRIVRLRPGAVTTLDLTFRRAGTYLVYCTVYCGPGHDMMHGRISVA